MAELKTKVNDANVTTFLDSIADEAKRKDSYLLFKMMQKATKNEARMWGDSIVGFGDYHYVGKSGREGDWFVTGFSPRKQNMTVYFCLGFHHLDSLMKGLGKFKTSAGSCLYLKKLSDIDIKVLKQMLKENKANLKTLIQKFNAR